MLCTGSSESAISTKHFWSDAVDDELNILYAKLQAGKIAGLRAMGWTDSSIRNFKRAVSNDPIFQKKLLADLKDAEKAAQAQVEMFAQARKQLENSH
jgi:hypothetical protein